ncbi:DUF2835 domain-containing protein [Hahella sp. HN01]|uniref:DUF2835 domain-containing protein n=1 Tax=Hahella sp. HN01 TaxID=2847262 RepID=UPI0020A6BB16|nr:DUF2835 domain-containing protein [Hahella sp. HN01]
MRQIIVDIHISAEEYLNVYRGSAKNVNAISREGLRVQFPANILQRFVTREGIRGSFVITFDDGNKFHSIEQLAY